MRTFILICTLLIAAPAWATSVAYSEASLDWTGFHWTLSEGLILTQVLKLDEQTWRIVSAPGEFTNVEFAPLNTSTALFPDYQASATAYGLNGFLANTAMAGTTTLSPDLAAYGSSSTLLSTLFFVYGSGSGTLNVSVPYTLNIGLHETNPYEVTSASAIVSFDAVQQVLAWDNANGNKLDGTLMQQGVLTASRSFDQGWDAGAGAGLLLGGHVSTTASALTHAVPEPSSLVFLLAAGAAWLAGLLGVTWYREWQACAHQHEGEGGRKLVH